MNFKSSMSNTHNDWFDCARDGPLLSQEFCHQLSDYIVAKWNFQCDRNIHCWSQLTMKGMYTSSPTIYICHTFENSGKVNVQLNFVGQNKYINDFLNELDLDFVT